MREKWTRLISNQEQNEKKIIGCYRFHILLSPTPPWCFQFSHYKRISLEKMNYFILYTKITINKKKMFNVNLKIVRIIRSGIILYIRKCFYIFRFNTLMMSDTSTPFITYVLLKSVFRGLRSYFNRMLFERISLFHINISYIIVLHQNIW